MEALLHQEASIYLGNLRRRNSSVHSPKECFTRAPALLLQDQIHQAM